MLFLSLTANAEDFDFVEWCEANSYGCQQYINGIAVALLHENGYSGVFVCDEALETYADEFVISKLKGRAPNHRTTRDVIMTVKFGCRDF